MDEMATEAGTDKQHATDHSVLMTPVRMDMIWCTALYTGPMAVHPAQETCSYVTH